MLSLVIYMNVCFVVRLLLLLTFTSEPKENFNLTLSILNCHGLKTNLGYVKDLVENNNVNFVCEHWLASHELSTVRSMFEEDNKWCHLQTSMDPMQSIKGRPFGGLGYICKHLPDTAYQILNIDSDRVCVLQIYYKGNISVTIIGVYLPYHDGRAEQVELFIDTLCKIQSLLDQFGESAPVIVAGDFNTSLPQADRLKHNWYNCRPFNRNSALLYNFIEDNDLIVANFLFEQNVNYTYSNVSNATYIDHILVPNYVMDLILKCDILKDDMSNMSDHYAVRILMDIPVYGVIDNGKEISRKFVKETHKPRWNDINYQEVYEKELKKY